MKINTSMFTRKIGCCMKICLVFPKIVSVKSCSQTHANLCSHCRQKLTSLCCSPLDLQQTFYLRFEKAGLALYHCYQLILFLIHLSLIDAYFSLYSKVSHSI